MPTSLPAWGSWNHLPISNLQALVLFPPAPIPFFLFPTVEGKGMVRRGQIQGTVRVRRVRGECPFIPSRPCPSNPFPAPPPFYSLSLPLLLPPPLPSALSPLLYFPTDSLICALCIYLAFLRSTYKIWNAAYLFKC